jgi:hypothetical protein
MQVWMLGVILPISQFLDLGPIWMVGFGFFPSKFRIANLGTQKNDLRTRPITNLKPKIGQH